MAVTQMRRKYDQAIRHLPLACVAIGFACSLSGCYLRPNWGSPGTIGSQRSRAVLFDPYPNNDLGPPVISGRPLGYERPLAEPEQNQYYQQSSQGGKVQPYYGF